MRRIHSLVLAIGLAAAASSTVQAADRTLRSADTHGAGYPTVAAVEFMSERVDALTGGALDIKVFHSRQLGEESDTIEMVRAGALDLVRVSLSPFTDLVPETQAFAMPFVFRSVEHAHAVLDGEIGRAVLDAFKPHGFIGLAYFDSGARSFYTVAQPVRRLADLAGLRIRIQSSDIIAATMEALGAVPQKMPFGEVGTALETGLIDGAENNWPSYEATGHFKAAPNYALSRHLIVPEVLIMSRRSWDGMTTDHQAAVRTAAGEAEEMMRRLWAERVRKARETVLATGEVTVTEIEDPERFREAVQVVYDRFAKTPALKNLVARIQAVQ